MKAEARYLEPIQSMEEKSSPKPDIFLSVIISAFNEQDQIDDTLNIVKDYLQNQVFNSEIMIVDGGNYDRTTEVIKKPGRYVYEFKEQRSSRVKRSIETLGQGFSLSRSILRTRGKYILCTDEELSVPIFEVEKMWPHVQAGIDVVLAFPKDGIKEPFPPFAGRKLGRHAVKTLAWFTSIMGTRCRQCKFKLFRREAARCIARAQKLYGRSFDIEQLYLAWAMGFSIKEVPVEWCPPQRVRANRQNDPGDSVRLLADVLRVLYTHWDLKR
ncbi:MAG: glycosyltransferase [bacterium]